MAVTGCCIDGDDGDGQQQYKIQFKMNIKTNHQLQTNKQIAFGSESANKSRGHHKQNTYVYDIV